MTTCMPKRHKFKNRPKARGCERCEFRGLIFNQLLEKSIPCPYCRQRRYDNTGLKLLTAAERRHNLRLAEQREAHWKLARESNYSAPLLAAVLDPVNRIMERWAVGMGDGLPDPDQDPQARPPPLDDGTQVVVDQIVQHSEGSIQWFVRQWYCSPVPVMVMARERSVSSRKLHSMHEAVLEYLEDRFRASRHADLIVLLICQT